MNYIEAKRQARDLWRTFGPLAEDTTLEFFDDYNALGWNVVVEKHGVGRKERGMARVWCYVTYEEFKTGLLKPKLQVLYMMLEDAIIAAPRLGPKF
jgi:hypothetical protein